MATLIRPNIFKPYSRLRAAMTMRGRGTAPYGLNFSHAVGDDPGRVDENRRALARQLGFPPEHLALQRQIHSDRVVYVDRDYVPGESDALVTDRPGMLLGAGIADCVPLLVYEPEREVIAAVHSGWRGSAQNIAGKTIAFLGERFGGSPAELRAWIGPGSGQCCYEVGEDVAGTFDARHSREVAGGKYLFDNRGVVLAQLLAAGVLPENVEVDPRCTICDERFHSFRRDGGRSGRMLAVIGMLEKEG